MYKVFKLVINVKFKLKYKILKFLRKIIYVLAFYYLIPNRWIEIYVFIFYAQSIPCP